MSMTAALHYLHWLCEELVRALLRPVFFRALALDTDSARSRFDGLVYRADCWPCRVSWSFGPCVYIHISSAPDLDEEEFA